MKNYNKIKNNQLGMPHGTANARLRKQLLYKYVVLAGDNSCYQCGERIESIDEFSIEHKIPWLYSSPDLFWDLDNIAFSHLKCNLGVTRKNTPGHIEARKQISLDKAITGPKDTNWCSGCQDFLDVNCFTKNKSKYRGYQSYCKDCRKTKR